VAHYCSAAELEDLADVLAEIRTWSDVVEKKPNVFYVRRDPFFHVHMLSGGTRRADVKGRRGWTQIELPRPVLPAARRALLSTLRLRYREK
jgi:hypothetical protein